MTKDTIQVDKTLFLKIAKGYDTLKKQVDHLESHLHDDLALDVPVPKGFFFTASFETPVSPDKQKVYMDQFRAELMSVLKQYGVLNFEGSYTK